MTVYLLREFNFNFTAPDFAFDATSSESHELPLDVTPYPIETGANLPDYVYELPDIFSVSGVVVAAPLDLAVPNPYRHVDVYDELLALARERQPVSVVSPAASPRDYLISRVSSKHDAGVGAALQVSIEFTGFSRPGYLTTQIPPELLRADVAPSTAPAPSGTGGAAAGTTPAAGSAEERSANSMLYDSPAYQSGNLDGAANAEYLIGRVAGG